MGCLAAVSCPVLRGREYPEAISKHEIELGCPDRSLFVLSCPLSTNMVNASDVGHGFGFHSMLSQAKKSLGSRCVSWMAWNLFLSVGVESRPLGCRVRNVMMLASE